MQKMIQYEVNSPRDIPTVLNKLRHLLQNAYQTRASVKAFLAVSQESFQVRSSDQNAKFHALIGDISKSVVFDGNQYSLDVWKALLIDLFEKELEANGESLTRPSETVISLDKKSLVTIRPSTTRFNKKTTAQFIEFLYSFGSANGATFREESIAIYNEVSHEPQT